MANHANLVLTPERQLLAAGVLGRLLNLHAVAFLSAALAIFLSLSCPPLARTAAGAAVALAAVIAGSFLSASRSLSSSGYCFGTALTLAGYGLAAYFALASFYVPGISGMEKPYICWAMELVLALAALIHLRKHTILKFAALPYTFCLSGQALYFGLQETQTPFFADLSLSAALSLFGVLYLALVSFLYKKCQLRSEKDQETVAALSFRAAHEFYFFATAALALALPWYLGLEKYAPLWWSLETPILLALCWKARSFVKHGLLMAVWILSASFLLAGKLDISALSSMSMPLSGLAMALAYRYLKSDWAKWQKLAGYGLYLYGAACLSLAIPLLQLEISQSTNYLLAIAVVLLGAAVLLADRLLQHLAAFVALAACLIFALEFRSWDLIMVVPVVLSCYAFNLVYGYLHKKGGLPASEFSLLPGEALSKRFALICEYAAGFAGYGFLLSSTYLLLPTPYNTAVWGAEALLLIAYGFLTRRVGHRFSGLVAMAIASAKLTIFDLSGAGTLTRTLVSFGAVGICCIAASIFYLVEYGRKQDDKPAE